MADKELELDAAEAAGYARGYQTCIVDYQPTAELLKSKLAMEKRVRELHTRKDWDVCPVCFVWSDEQMEYVCYPNPCPTIKALDGEQ